VKQSFATEVGQEYELQFQFAGNPRGIALDPQADPFKAVEVQIAGQTLQFDLTVNQLGDPFVPHWQQRTVKFTATEPMTTVQFLSLAPDSTGPSSNYGPTLDDVVVRKVNNLVVNGSFEVADDAGLTGLPGAPSEPPSHAAPIYVLPQGSTALSGWTVAGVSAEDTVDWVHQTHIGASNGLRSVDLNGTPGLGSVSQTIATEVGRTYVMSFDLAGNPYGNGTSPASDPVKRIAVTIGGETIEYAHLVRGADSALRPGWQRYTTQFTATSAATLLRFASLAPDLGGPAGSGDYGAMLDNVVVFHADYGDLPNSYATLHSADGGRHLAQGAMLGTGRDFESDGQPGPDALLDGWDEDGVFIPTMQPGDTTAWMEVRVSQADIGQQLDAWIDFNADGAWDEPGEQVASTITVVEGLNRIYFAVPMDAVIGDVGARIRLSSNSLGTPTGLASDGEVEDYLARIDAPGSIAGVLWNDLNSNAVRDSVLVGGDDPDLVIVIDVSGSTSSSFAGSSVGNLNGDGLSDTILDAEIAGVYAILDYLIAEGKGQTSQVSIVTFSSGSTILDLNPVAGGLQASATPEADVDNNGIADIRQQIATIFSSGGTDFAAGLGAAKQAVDLVGTLRENANVIFMSDGVGQRDFGGALQLLRDRVSTIRAFGVGAGSSLDQLRQIDSRTVQFSTTDELIDAFSGFGSESLFAEPGIPAWEIYLDLNGNGQPDANEPRTRTSTDDPSTFANEAGKFRFDGLAAGTYEVRQVLPPGWWQTYPGLDADQTHTVVVVGGEVTEAVDFGVVFNQLPQAISDEVTVQWGSNATFDTRSNDFDPNGGPLTLRSVTNATNGTLEINNGQSITYTPAVGFSGVDSFTYTISDANGLQSTSTVTIILNGPATDLIFNNAVTDLNENSDNSNGTLLAELEVIDDDGLGTNYLSLSGTDAALFELIGNQLWLKAGVILDHESQVSFEVDINVDDPAIGSTPDLTRPFVLTINDLAEVVDVQFGDGTLQRSNVSQVIVTFDGVVDLGAGAFVLTERSSGTEVTTLVTTNSGPNGETIAQLIFSGGLTRNGGNLLDGNYRLQINATDVTRDGQEMDGDRDGVVGGDLVRGENAADAFFALFGDVNGDRTIRLAEFNQFRNTFGTNSLGGNYDGRFDFDDDEVIGLADFNQFRRRFGTSLDF
jgi:choice-of-anchor C domain-containing protein